MLTIEDRLERMERENVRLRKSCRRAQFLSACVMALLVGAVSLGMTQRKPRELKVSKLTVVDQDGNTGITLSCDKQWGTRLGLHVPGHKGRILAAVNPPGVLGKTAELSISDSRGLERFRLVTGEHDQYHARFQVLDGSRKMRLEAFTNLGNGVLAAFDSEGHRRWVTETFPTMTARTAVYDQNDDMRWAIESNDKNRVYEKRDHITVKDSD